MRKIAILSTVFLTFTLIVILCFSGTFIQSAQAQTTTQPKGCSAGLDPVECGRLQQQKAQALNPTSSIPEVKDYEQGRATAESSNTTNVTYLSGVLNDNNWSWYVVQFYGSDVLKKEGALSSGGKMIALLYKPAADPGLYFADLMNSAGLNVAPSAYAQGLGFAALNPILETWKIFRNIAYFFYVIIFLAIGFMIMFRQKVGSQTVVTVQQALPKIIVSLIFVTFSYAIAGLLIDVMYLAMYFLIGIFSSSAGGSNITQYGIGTNIFQLGGVLLADSKLGTLGTVNKTVQDLLIDLLGDTSSPISQGLAWVGGLIVAVIFGFALLFSIFRLFFELLKTYISIVISIVMSPLVLMMGALPGNNAFQGWFKSLFFHLAVFPAVLLVLILAFVLKDTAVGGSATAIGSTPTNITGTTQQNVGGFLPPYLIGQGSSAAVSALLGMGILLILPELVIQVKKMGGGNSLFEQFANNIGTAFNKGITGDTLIPGLAFTKVPGAQKVAERGYKTTKGIVQPITSQFTNRLLIGGPRELTFSGVRKKRGETETPERLAPSSTPRGSVNEIIRGTNAGKSAPEDI